MYTISKTIDGEFDAVLERTVEALDAEGFGVLTEIDVQATFAEKLDAEFRRYRILGACNPPLAQEALGEALEIGALLPCNVVVYETDEGAVRVSAVEPESMLSVVGNPAVDELATEVSDRLERALDGVAAAADA